MFLFEIQRICASPASPSAIFFRIFLQEGVGRVSKGVDLPEKRIFCIIKQGKKTREVTSPGPWPLITYKHDKKRKLIRLKGRNFHDFTRILLEKVGVPTYL